MTRSSILAASCLILISAAVARADNWPQWRGPDNNGIVKETKLPTKWSEKTNVLWKIPMPGRGGATPIVWGDRIFVVSGEKDAQVLLCISTDGKQLWKRTVGSGGRLEIKGDEANEASASPCTDGKHVYVFVGSGNFACFDFDGKEVWKTNIQEKYGKFKIQHGLHTSPLLHEDRLFLSLIHNNGHFVVAFDKATGKEVWKIERQSDAKGESREAYSSPILWNDGTQTSVVILGADYATGHRLDDGAEMWRLGDLSPKAPKYRTDMRVIATPVATTGLLVVPTARSEIIVGVKPGAKGMIKTGSPFEMWRKTKGAPDVSSVLIHDGLVYACKDNGVLQCWEAKTGNEVYQERLHADRYRASPIYADGKVYIPSRDGTFSVVKAGPKFEIVATNNLPDVFTASPAVSQGRIYLRGFQSLYAIQESAK